MLIERNCAREYGPHHGTWSCAAHFRVEVWRRGRLVAWCSFELNDEERAYFFSSLVG